MHIQDAVEEFLVYLRRVLRFFVPRTKGDGRDPTTVVKFKSTDRIAYYLIAHVQQTTSTLFEAELFRMEPALSHLDDGTRLPMLLGLCPGPVVCGTRWPDVQDEHEVAMSLLCLDLAWEISVMTSRPALLGQRYITAETVVSASDAKDKDTVQKQQAAALRAFNAVAKPAPATAAARSKRKSGVSAARTSAPGRASGAAASSSDRPPAAFGPPGAESGSESSDSTGPSVSDEDITECWRTVLKSLKTQGKRSTGIEKARLERPLVSDHARVEVPDSVPDAPAVAPPLARGPRGQQAPPGARFVQHLGLATLSQVVSGGRVIGYGIVCGRHRNTADKRGSTCKKQCLLHSEGPRAISHDEAKLRLKRWFVLGQFQELAWPAGMKRTTHLKCAGQAMELVASGTPGWSDMTDDELDDACRLVPAAT